ncbi:hypothetical protein PIB30_079161 [Stylosanthes scabra]|uniref:Uncharacterized protein n=1 Tax=Stylosanthes scabra TaxID=79078 RepID=A0ABU6YPV6_9FABA|nr:hypothetical protein [Stylosanthes scabra]
MNTCNSRVLLKSSDRETTLFVTDMTKANVMIPRLIKWDEIDLPRSWSIDRAIPTQPRQAPLLQEIKQDETGRVEIVFDRRNSFSSRSEAGTVNDFASARRSFFVTLQSQCSSRIPRFVNPRINISGLQNNSNISQLIYQTDDDVDLQSIQSPTYSSLNDDVHGFLQCLGENLSSSKSSSLSLQDVSEASTSKPIEKTLFKPLKMSSKAKQTLKTSILKQDTSKSEVMQKIDLLLNRLNTVPETPTNSGESISRIQTHSSKAINAFNQESSETSDSDQSQFSKQTTLKVSPIMANSMTR